MSSYIGWPKKTLRLIAGQQRHLWGQNKNRCVRDVASFKVMGDGARILRICRRELAWGYEGCAVSDDSWKLPKKGDRNYLPIRANVFFMTVKNMQKFGFSIFQHFLLQFAPNEDTNFFLWIFWGKKILSNKINFSQKMKKHWI